MENDYLNGKPVSELIEYHNRIKNILENGTKISYEEFNRIFGGAIKKANTEIHNKYNEKDLQDLLSIGIKIRSSVIEESIDEFIIKLGSEKGEITNPDLKLALDILESRLIMLNYEKLMLM